MTVEPAHPGVRKIKAYMTEAEDDGLPAPDLLLNSNESVFGPSPQAIDRSRICAPCHSSIPENVRPDLSSASTMTTERADRASRAAKS